MDHTAENGAPCLPEAPFCEAHKAGRSWLLTCPTPPAATEREAGR